MRCRERTESVEHSRTCHCEMLVTKPLTRTLRRVYRQLVMQLCRTCSITSVAALQATLENVKDCPSLDVTERERN